MLSKSYSLLNFLNRSHSPAFRYGVGGAAYAGTFAVDSVGGTRITTFTTGSDGRYAVELAPGSYQVHLRDANAMPSMATQASRSSGPT